MDGEKAHRKASRTTRHTISMHAYPWLERDLNPCSRHSKPQIAATKYSLLKLIKEKFGMKMSINKTKTTALLRSKTMLDNKLKHKKFKYLGT
jgi:hypothetical protein